ncbi:MAG: efflux RND transporter periplasmic adaptor subunit [Gemmatimonadetes bacterium]|nr:efflux RND transporter periplasmic adaptor subunit [Gemmatimonadota bacterium]
MTRFTRSWKLPAVWGATILAALSIGYFGASMRSGATHEHDAPAQGMETDAAEATTWTCSMHPQIQMPESGQCPICGMDLIPIETSAGGADDGPRTLTLSPGARAIAEVQTVAAVRRPVAKSLRLLGTVEVAEPRVREITAWVPGRVEKLYVDFEGASVRRGDRLYELYSPEAYSAQEALIQAGRASARTGSASSAVDAARERLRLWGLTDAQISSIEKSGTPMTSITIVAPVSGTITHRAVSEGSTFKEGQHLFSITDLSQLWLQLDAYESDLPWLRTGQDVLFETGAFPGETFEGSIEFIDPTLAMKTRTAKVRVAVKNEDGRLKPGLFARATIRAPWTGDEGAGDPLVIPATAPLVTGKRAVVYVEEEPGRYAGREVVLGTRAGDMQVVRSGLREGERVVTNGAFKIDSALQIQAKTSMMSAGSTDHGTISAIFRKSAGGALGHYLAVSTALSVDDLGSAKKAATALAQELQAIDPSVLARTARSEWEALSMQAARAAHALEGAADLAAARGAFLPMSNAMIPITETFRPEYAKTVSIFHCPMADHNKGADWLQTGSQTENPYFGSAMYRCGSLTKVVLSRDAAASESQAAQ